VLIDFGAARNVLHKGGKYLQPMFTPGFSAPEMYKRGKSVGPWTDIYAIGACIFSCMKGCPPPDASTAACREQLEVLVSGLRGKYSVALIELVLACLQTDPQSRPHSVLAVQKVLSNPPQDPVHAGQTDGQQAAGATFDPLRPPGKFSSAMR
jgi:serine/threonine protein kinase